MQEDDEESPIEDDDDVDDDDPIEVDVVSEDSDSLKIMLLNRILHNCLHLNDEQREQPQTKCALTSTRDDTYINT